MARKQSKEDRPVSIVETASKSIRLELPPDIHQQFRVEAAKEGASMAAVARRLVEDYLRRKTTGK